jgi:two-component system nitrate/nitrite response regulator NarL
MSRTRVLIVDDRPIFRAGVQGMLKDFPEIEVVGEASNGTQAVERAHSFNPDVVLMDLNLPEMDGIAATRAIRAQNPDMVILALTVSEAEEDVVEMLAAGAAGYVLKDVDPANLVRAINDARSGRFQLDDALTRRVIVRLGSALARQPRSLPIEPLTERETEILRMVVQGMGNKAIAGRLNLSEGTIKSHLRNIYRKLRVKSRPEAAAQAVRLDI